MAGPAVDKAVETVDSRRQLCRIAALPEARSGAGAARPESWPGWVGLPGSSTGVARLVAGLGWSGDPGVLPVRHSVERARTTT